MSWKWETPSLSWSPFLGISVDVACRRLDQHVLVFLLLRIRQEKVAVEDDIGLCSRDAEISLKASDTVYLLRGADLECLK